MAEVTASVVIWEIQAEDISLAPNEKAPHLLRLELCKDVRIVLDRDTADVAGRVAAMRKLARLATEAAEDLENRVAGKDGSDGD